MAKENKLLDRNRIASNPDYYPVESDGEVFQMVQEMLEETVFGQTEACAEVSRAITRSVCGFHDPNRPEYVGLFLGEPGVGKTEMGKAIAKIFDPKYYEERLLVVDCNMFQQSHDVSRILGAPPGYLGYGDEPFITKQFLHQQNVIVFDEIEKADSALHRMLLRIMDKGRLEINESDAAEDFQADLPGLDFSQSIIILTSNIGSKEIAEIKADKGKLGFLAGEGDGQNKDAKRAGIEAAKKYWKYMPEFLNRIDSTIVFNSLTEKVVYQLIDKFLDEYYENQPEYGTIVLATNELKEWIVSQTDTKQAGRGLRRKLDKMIITPAAEVKIKMPKGVPLIADVSQDEPKRVIFWVSKTMVSSMSHPQTGS